MATASAMAAEAKPNIVVIVADDLGYGELSCYGSKLVNTPNIDAIAASGVRFTDAYVTCPVSSPTRAGLITGRYQQRFGHELNPTRIPNIGQVFGLPPGVQTIPQRLKADGYTTALYGKWHLGERAGCFPWERGIDRFYGFLAGGHSYTGDTPADPIRRGKSPVAQNGYLTDAITSEACSFIREKHDAPYIAYVTYNAIHLPLHTAPGREQRFAHITDPQQKQVATALAAMDDGVGEIAKALRETGQERNTIVMFLSDNGGIGASSVVGNIPLRGFKTQVYEGGIRVPMMISWPGRIEGGGVYTKPVISLDLAATALAVAGSSSAKDPEIEGVNLLPYLGDGASGTPHEAIFWRFGNKRAVRMDNWKLVAGEGRSVELYDLSADVSEKNDLASQQQEVVARLEQAYRQWDSRNIPPIWDRPARRPGMRTAEPAQ